jgi:hypothetical protein
VSAGGAVRRPDELELGDAAHTKVAKARFSRYRIVVAIEFNDPAPRRS